MPLPLTTLTHSKTMSYRHFVSECSGSASLCGSTYCKVESISHTPQYLSLTEFTKHSAITQAIGSRISLLMSNQDDRFRPDIRKPSTESGEISLSVADHSDT